MKQRGPIILRGGYSPGWPAWEGSLKFQPTIHKKSCISCSIGGGHRRARIWRGKKMWWGSSYSCLWIDDRPSELSIPLPVLGPIPAVIRPHSRKYAKNIQLTWKIGWRMRMPCVQLRPSTSKNKYPNMNHSLFNVKILRALPLIGSSYIG